MTEDELNPPGLKTFYWHYAWVIVVIIASMQIVGTSIRMAFGVFIGGVLVLLARKPSSFVPADADLPST